MKGRKIEIIASAQLKQWKLSKMVGRKGVILATKFNEKNKGCWVRLNEPFCEEPEWFIPIQSIQLLTNTHGTTD